MRGETWVSWGASFVGAAIPLSLIGPGVVEDPALVPVAGVVVLPFVLVAGTGWAVRSDRRASRIIAIVGVLVLVIALGGWSWAAQYSEGVAMILVSLLFIPAVQLLIWLGGAVCSGSRPRAGLRAMRVTELLDSTSV